MVSINEYLDNILDDFKYYLSCEPSLCKLKSVNFDAGQLPDYTDVHVQQLYLLRYAFAYAFEYKCMYLHLIDRFDFRGRIKIMSIGCGNMIDYWSLVMALKERKKTFIEIDYVGLDQIDWSYKIQNRHKDNVRFVRCDAVEALEECNSLNANVYFFPKSISEFSEHDFGRICNCFNSKQIVPDTIHISISIRSDQFSMERDMARTDQIIRAVVRNGFTTKDDSEHFWSLNLEEPKISKSDGDFKHPSEIIGILKELNQFCVHFQKTMKNCDDSCKQRLSRWPILNKDKIKYQILTFVRGR